MAKRSSHIDTHDFKRREAIGAQARNSFYCYSDRHSYGWTWSLAPAAVQAFFIDQAERAQSEAAVALAELPSTRWAPLARTFVTGLRPTHGPVIGTITPAEAS